MLSTHLANLLKKMISLGNAASSHIALIPLKTAYKKRGELLWAIASKRTFISLHSAAFVTVFGRAHFSSDVRPIQGTILLHF